MGGRGGGTGKVLGPRTVLGVVASGDGPWKEARGPRAVVSVVAGGGTGNMVTEQDV